MGKLLVAGGIFAALVVNTLQIVWLGRTTGQTKSRRIHATGCRPTWLQEAFTKQEGTYLSSGAKSGLTKSEAEDFLDWLEVTGRGPARVLHNCREAFTVVYGDEGKS